MPTQVLLDNQIFTQQVRGGVSRYFVELIRNRDLLGRDLELELRLGATVNEHLGTCPDFSGRYIRADTNSARDKIVRRMIRELGRLAPTGFRSADILHHTYYDPAVLQRTQGVTRVSTLYDMIPELRPEHFQSNPHLAKRQYFEQSDLIISISRASADDLLSYWPHLASREIAIVPLGVSDLFTSTGPRHVEPRPYLLFVGNRVGYKNFTLLLRAVANNDAGLADLGIIAVGSPFSAAEKADILELGLESRVRQTGASDAELAALYRGARAFVFPSLHEGFGLPALEAMACGCPTILSETPVFREVGEDAALYFDPTSPESLADTISSIDGGANEQELIRRGTRLASLRTWRAVAENTGTAYSLVV